MYYLIPNAIVKKDYFTDVNIIYFLHSNFTFNSSLQKYCRLSTEGSAWFSMKDRQKGICVTLPAKGLLKNYANIHVSFLGSPHRSFHL